MFRSDSALQHVRFSSGHLSSVLVQHVSKCILAGRVGGVREHYMRIHCQACTGAVRRGPILRMLYILWCTLEVTWEDIVRLITTGEPIRPWAAVESARHAQVLADHQRLVSG